MQGGRLQLVLDDRSVTILHRIGTGVGTGLVVQVIDRCVPNFSLDAAVLPGLPILVHRWKVSESIVPGVSFGIGDDIICGKLDGNDVCSHFRSIDNCRTRGHAGQAGPLLCGLVIGSEAAIPRNILPCSAAVIGALQHNRDAGGAQAVLVVAVHPVLADIVGCAQAVGQDIQGKVPGLSRCASDCPVGLYVAIGISVTL